MPVTPTRAVLIHAAGAATAGLGLAALTAVTLGDITGPAAGLTAGAVAVTAVAAQAITTRGPR